MGSATNEADHRPCGPTARGTRAPIGLALAVALLAVSAYHRAPTLDFVFDDAYFLRENPFVARGLTADGLRWALTASVAGLWHPVTLVSHMAVVQLFGATPAAHHAVNVLLHAANAILLFTFLARATGAPRRSAAVAALFAVHPLQVEVVAWVAERKELLSTFFGLLALHTWRGWLARRGGARALAVALLFALALASKPTLVTLPFLLLLLDFWPFGRRLGWPVVGEKLPLLALSAAASAIALLTQTSHGALVSGTAAALPERLAGAAAAYGSYLGMVAWPQGLAVMYPRPERVPAPAWLAGAALAGALLALAFGLRRRLPALATGVLWFLGALVPVIGLVPVGAQAHADRYAYVPVIGLLVALAWTAVAGQRASRGRQRAAGIAAAGAVAACAALTLRQVPVWTDNRRLFEHAVAVAPGSWMMHGNLVGEYLAAGEPERALRHARELLRLRPGFAESHYNLACALQAAGRTDAAVAEYREALRRDPRLVAADRNLGLLLERAGRRQEALPHLRRAGLWPP